MELLNSENLDELINSLGEICTGFRGVSMNPLLKMNRDRVYIVKNKERLKKWDVALFKRDNGQYVLHRVIKVMDKYFIICGDNQDIKEPVREDQILGYAVGFYKKTKYITFENNFWYNVYVTLWCKTFFFRRIWFFIRRCLHFGYRVLKKIVKVFIGIFKHEKIK